MVGYVIFAFPFFENGVKRKCSEPDNELIPYSRCTSIVGMKVELYY